MLKVNIQEVGYPCSKCKYVVTQQSNLKSYIESKQGVRYQFSQCEYIVNTAVVL